MWSTSHHYSLIQQGNGNLEAESEESEVSQDSFPGETEHLELWSRIHDEAEKRLPISDGNPKELKDKRCLVSYGIFWLYPHYHA